MNLYELEELFVIFCKHTEQSEKQRIENITSFQENNPGEDLPSYMKDDFNLARALSSICFEILKIKSN